MRRGKIKADDVNVFARIQIQDEREGASCSLSHALEVGIPFHFNG